MRRMTKTAAANLIQRRFRGVRGRREYIKKFYDTERKRTVFYIRGTRSPYLPHLKDQEFTLRSTHESLKNNGRVALVGEVEGGNYEERSADASPSFGIIIHPRLKSEVSHYRLRSVIDYSTRYAPKLKSLKKTVKRSVNTAYDSDFSNINELLIFLSRAKQLGADLKEVIGDVNKLYNRLDATIEFFYLCRLIGSYIYPAGLSPSDIGADVAPEAAATTEASSELARIPDVIYVNFQHKKIIDKMSKNICDAEYGSKERRKLADLVKQLDRFSGLPDTRIELHEQEALRPALAAVIEQYLTLPGEIGDIAYAAQSRTCSLEEQIVLTARYKYPFKVDLSLLNDKNKSGRDARGRNHYTLFDKPIDFPSFNDAMCYELEKNNPTDSRQWKSDCDGYLDAEIKALEERREILKKLIEDPFVRPELSELEKDMLDKPFPIILMHDNSDIVELYRYEYRATRPIVLGTDITMIATDSKENAKKLREYCFSHPALCKVDIFLFEQLEWMQYSGKVPTPHHSGAKGNRGASQLARCSLTARPLPSSRVTPAPAAMSKRAMQQDELTGTRPLVVAESAAGGPI
jgi:hypothetical protein